MGNFFDEGDIASLKLRAVDKIMEGELRRQWGEKTGAACKNNAGIEEDDAL